MQAEILQTCTDAGRMRTKSQSISILNHYENAHMYPKRIEHQIMAATAGCGGLCVRLQTETK